MWLSYVTACLVQALSETPPQLEIWWCLQYSQRDRWPGYAQLSASVMCVVYNLCMYREKERKRERKRERERGGVHQTTFLPICVLGWRNQKRSFTPLLIWMAIIMGSRSLSFHSTDKRVYACTYHCPTPLLFDLPVTMKTFTLVASSQHTSNGKIIAVLSLCTHLDHELLKIQSQEREHPAS